MSDIFSPDTYAAVRLPLHEASNLPAWCYTSQEWYERELDSIFRGPGAEWLCVGRVDQVPNPGDFYTLTLIGKPLIIVRDREKRVHVHVGICRHRGALLAEGKQGTCRTFVCPYHSWTYDLDGKLRGCPGNPPPMEDTANFRLEDNGLLPVTSDTWAGFIFVTFNPQPRPLKDWLGGFPAFVANYNIEDMRFTHRDIYEVECNWKVWMENAFENYHTPTIHRRHIDRSKPLKWVFPETNGPFDAMFSHQAIVGYTGLPKISTLSEDEAKGLYHIWLRPTLQIILNSSYMKYRQYLPEGPGKLRLIENWSFPSATVARPDFAETVGPTYYDKYAQIIREDLTISPNVQRGLATGSFQPGRYSTEEHIVHRIANYVLDRVVGPVAGSGREGIAKKRPLAAV